MELTAEQIKENWDKFLDIITTYISEPRRTNLLKFYNQYSDRIIMMPASHKPQYHNCFAGGYTDHVLRVVESSLKTEKIWIEMGVEKNWTTEELIFSAINHDLGKMGNKDHEAYIDNPSQWHKDNRGEIYSYNTKLSFMAVPDRSLFLLNQHGISYSENEFLAIKLHDGIYDESNKAYLMPYMPESRPRTSLVYIIHHADMMAARIEFEREQFPKFYKETTKVTTSFSSPKVTKEKRKDKALESMTTPALSKAVNSFFNK